jgi:hypothetical protein
MDLASWQEEGGDHRGVAWVTVDRGGGKKNKQWSESVLEVTPYTTESGTSDMSQGSFGHVR